VQRLADQYPGQPKVYIMDNVSCHRSRRVRKCITNAGHTVMILPACSPFLNPVENAFSAIRAEICRAGADVLPIDDQINEAITTLTQEKAEGWFRLAQRNFQLALVGQPSTDA
jgi:transposase